MALHPRRQYSNSYSHWCKNLTCHNCNSSFRLCACGLFPSLPTWNFIYIPIYHPALPLLYGHYIMNSTAIIIIISSSNKGDWDNFKITRAVYQKSTKLRKYKKRAILSTAHILQKVLILKYKTLFTGEIT
jgi:hypothetical protein